MRTQHILSSLFCSLALGYTINSSPSKRQSTNLLVNPGFEDPGGIAPWYFQDSVDDPAPFDKSSSKLHRPGYQSRHDVALLCKSSAGYTGAGVYQDVSGLTPGANYTITYYYKQHTGANCYVVTASESQYNATGFYGEFIGGYPTDSNGNPSGQWNQYAVTLTPQSETDTIDVHLICAGGGQQHGHFNFDDFSLTAD